MTKPTVIAADPNPNKTLADSWEDYAAQMRAGGAGEYQIDAMKITFYLGAAQVYVCIDRAARTDRAALGRAMGSLYTEIDDQIMTNSVAIHHTEGNA